MNTNEPEYLATKEREGTTFFPCARCDLGVEKTDQKK